MSGGYTGFWYGFRAKRELLTTLCDSSLGGREKGSQGMPTILCVDDSPKTLRLLGSILQLCGYSVLTARDPDAALKLAGLKRFDLAILDYQLPNRSGTSLAKAIKRVKPQIPIMLFSGAISLAIGELSDVDACVSKGESVDVMLHKVRNLLRQAGTGVGRDNGADRGPTKEPRDQAGMSGQNTWRYEMEQHSGHA